MTAEELHRAIERCDREIAEAETQTDAPAYLVTLGIEDWEREKRRLLDLAKVKGVGA